VVVTGLAVVVDDAPPAAVVDVATPADEVVVGWSAAGPGPVELDPGAVVVVVDSAFLDGPEPREQAAPITTRMRTRTRRFTGAHHRGAP
jgi:hypothetical protein